MEEDDPKYQKAKTRVRKMRHFYTNVVTYFLVNIILIIVNLLVDPGELWFYWVTLIWGIVLIVQAFNIFTIRDSVLGDAWEKKKINELMDKDDKNKPSE